MIDALYNGITGLNAFQTALNTESNNMSNVNTVGYKADKISFADQMYQSSIGKGVVVDNIDKNFNQGNLKITNNDYDMAIQGKGFFIVQGDNTKELFYTRAGNFRVANDGTLRLPNGYKVQGLAPTASDLLSSDDTKLFDSSYSDFIASQTLQDLGGKLTKTINAKSTDYNYSASNDLETKHGYGYKTREVKIADIEMLKRAYQDELQTYSTNQIPGTVATNQVSTVNFDLTKINNSLDSLEITIGNTTYNQQYIDSKEETLKLLADQISATKGFSASVGDNGALSITDILPGETFKLDSAKILNGASVVTPPPQINTTNAVIGNGKAKVDSVELALKTALENADSKYLRITTEVDSSDMKSKTIGDLQMQLDALNISESPFGTPEIEDGVIYVNQGDNRFVVGKVSTALFVNELGLDPKGDNLYAQTVQSGEFSFATNENKVLSKTLELSNSDLSKSLVDLMVYQRAFESSSKAVTTSDEFLKTAIALKR